MPDTPKMMTTYRRKDGQQIDGEFDWVIDLDFFEYLDEPVEIITETWVLGAAVTSWVGPGPYCPECGEQLDKTALDNDELTFCSEQCYDAHVAGVKADRAEQ